MRTRMLSPLPLLVGLTLGLLAMWASAAPLGATGDLVTGGWSECTLDAEEPYTYFAVPSDWHCLNHCGSGKCSNSYSSACSSYSYGECTGSSISVVSCYYMGPYDLHVGFSPACECDDGETFYVYDGFCY